MTSLFKDNRGFALILIILIISLLVVVTLQFNTAMWGGLYSSANLRDGVKFGLIARSGIHFALAVLSEDASASNSDSLRETWAQSKELSLHSVELFEQGRFQVEITDLSSKIAINRLVNENGEYNESRKLLLARLLSQERFGLEPEAVGNLIDAIKDWIDADDETTQFGAENGYYQSLEKPYSCANKPMDSLDQLRLVKGMTDALFFGNDDAGGGISDHLTVYGDGRININTAGPLVLQALSDDIDAEMVQDMVDYRLDKKNDLTDPEWYRKIAGMGHVTIDPNLIMTSTGYFEIRSVGMAEEEAMSRQVTTVVKREGSAIQIVAWKVE